ATGGDILVKAEEAASLTASTTSELLASSAVLMGKYYRPFKKNSPSSSLAAGGLIGTNLVQGAADAAVRNSTLTTGSTASGEGDVVVEAINAATLDANVVNAVTASVESFANEGKSATGAEADAIGVTLAFNTIG